jgi:hypothetical protein
LIDVDVVGAVVACVAEPVVVRVGLSAGCEGDRGQEGSRVRSDVCQLSSGRIERFEREASPRPIAREEPTVGRELEQVVGLIGRDRDARDNGPGRRVQDVELCELLHVEHVRSVKGDSCPRGGTRALAHR